MHAYIVLQYISILCSALTYQIIHSIYVSYNIIYPCTRLPAYINVGTLWSQLWQWLHRSSTTMLVCYVNNLLARWLIGKGFIINWDNSRWNRCFRNPTMRIRTTLFVKAVVHLSAKSDQSATVGLLALFLTLASLQWTTLTSMAIVFSGDLSHNCEPSWQ